MRPARLFDAASASYAANVALGSAVATRLIDSSGFRWVHHAVYVLTVVLTLSALSTATFTTVSRRKVIALAPATLPLALMPYASVRSGRHVLVALAAAPFFAASLLVREA